MKFQRHLQTEMYRLQQSMAPMMSKITQGLGFGGYGGYPEMGNMGGMENMGGMPTMEQL